MKTPALVAVLDPDPLVRLAAVDRVERDEVGRYALRNLMLADGDGRVRAAAATKLARSGEPALADALLEAAQTDPKPLVREAAWRALARKRLHGALRAQVIEAADRSNHRDPVWWVRMASTLALAAAGEASVVPQLCAVLDDPFWRVRNAAVQALLALGAAAPDVRVQVLGRAPGSKVHEAAIEYLRRRWNDEDARPLVPDAEVPPADPLWDPDPAVITARLEHPDAAPSLSFLIELLADPHESLRKLAARHLARTEDVRALRAALIWLEEPRIPHAARTVADVINRLGDLATRLVEDVLASPNGVGAVVWALGWIGKTGSLAFAEAVRAHLGHEVASVRRAAIGGASELGIASELADELVALADDADDDVQCAAIDVLCRVVPDRARILLDRDPAALPTRARRSVAQLALATDDERWLAAATGDSDVVTRAMVIGRRQMPGFASDPDPWVRAASMNAAVAARAVHDDPDPGVRRAALRSLIRAGASAPDLTRLATDPDPWLRAHLCRLLDPLEPGQLCALLELSFDTQPMVRGAATDRFEREGVDAAIRELLATAKPSVVATKAAYTWLTRAMDEAAARDLARAYALSDASEEVRAHLRALRLVLSDSEALADVPVIEAAPRVRREPMVQAPAVAEHRRRLGRTGLEVSPLAISGANDIVTSAVDRAYEAGVNLYFWEPRYQSLARFLRRGSVRDNVHVVAGTYHGSPEAIEADVDTALRRLRRDRIDLFLIFWVRSEARLSPEIFACLDRLKRSGKIGAAGFSTHHRELARAAIIAQPWDAVMIRHSAAHTGAEDTFFPEAEARDVGVLTFTALCYGRLLNDSPDHAAPTAPDCYRYSLSQPAVGAVISAPARYRELRENLEVLARPRLDPDSLATLREHGRWVYGQSKDFNALVRRTPRALPAAQGDRLRALLDELVAKPRI